jgi:hypothetical protein
VANHPATSGIFGVSHLQWPTVLLGEEKRTSVEILQSIYKSRLRSVGIAIGRVGVLIRSRVKNFHFSISS